MPTLKQYTNEEPSMRSGLYTSEFWVAIIAFVVTSLLLLVGVVTEDTWRWMAGASVVAYIVSRGIAKT